MKESHKKIIEEVRAAGRSIEQVLVAVPDEQLDTQPEKNAWSITEIAFHVRNVATLAYGLRIRRLIYEWDPLFPDYDEESELVRELSKQQPVEITAAMIRSEHELIADLLELLPDEAWRRSGRHPQSGELSIEVLAQRLIEHAQEHYQQIQTAIQELSAGSS